jgi:hypothetical protein
MTTDLPYDFDWTEYVRLNDDLNNFDDKTAINHFLLYGFSEKRYYKMIDLNNKNVVLITSKIYVSDKKFSYINIRSIYTVQERFEQTLETIFSIKKNIPESYIILIDNSEFNDKYYEILNKSVDKFINITNNDLLNFFTNEYEYKAFADISQQLLCYDIFLKYVDPKSIKYFFKISGRYLINDTFNFNTFDNENIIFKKNQDVVDRDYYYTCFYKLNSNFISEYFNNLKILIKNKHLYENDVSDLEVILPKLMIDKINLIDNLGILERIAVFKGLKNI